MSQFKASLGLRKVSMSDGWINFMNFEIFIMIKLDVY